jgi:hypothetical protein
LLKGAPRDWTLGLKAYFSRWWPAQPHSWSTLFVEFHPRLFECAADGLIIGPRERGHARPRFGATNGGDAYRRVAGEVFGASSRD